MRIRIFPTDLEGVGSYRLLYPYGQIDKNTEHEVVLEGMRTEDGKILMPFPEAMIGYREPSPQGFVEMKRFLDCDTYIFSQPKEKMYPGVFAKLKMEGKKIVVDVDDWLFGIPQKHEATKYFAASKHESLQALDICIRVADVVTVSTEALFEQMKKKNENVVLLRNKLSNMHTKNLRLSYETERPTINIGWVGWMTHRDNDLALIKPWLNRFLKRHPNVRFVNVGTRDALDYLCVPRDKRIDMGRAVFPKHFNLMQEIDIGLVPLASGMFNECKSYLKGMEYGAVGATLVATPTHEFAKWTMSCWNGVLATNDWEESLEWLVSDDNWRRCAEENYSKAQKNLIEDHYTEWMEATGCETRSLSLSRLGIV